ncbi:MAG TPA: Usg family protein [Alphaproteobacteria bacterium]|nr:Usg family protein [Alphaproteobacteria bacterium]
MTNLEKQLAGYRLTTAEIVYRLPDHPLLLQSFVWQKLDLAPKYPVLQRFLDFWEEEIDAKIHSVRVAQRSIVSAAELRAAADAGYWH